MGLKVDTIQNPSSATVNLTLDTSGNVAVGGALGAGGANYGTSGQVLTSAGSGAAPTWATASKGNFQDQLFTSSGTWTAPTGVTKVRVTVIGGGAGSFFNGTGFAGAAGGVAVGSYTVTPGTVYTVTVGAGSAGVSTGTSAAGGTSSFGALISATGGAGTSSTATGAAGAGSGGTIMNSYSSGGSSAGGFVPWFRNATTQGQFAGSAPSTAVPYSATWSAANGPAGAGGFSAAVSGGMGGIVYVEWVG